MIYLDNAATTGQKPMSVIKAVNNALINYNFNPGRSGYSNSLKTAEEVYKCRKALKDFFNATSENNVCFTYNCTQAINMVLNGVLNKGDHIIISSLEHNAVFRPINYLHKEKGIEFDIANVDLISDEITIKNIEKHIKKNTKMIFLTAASNVLGRKLPITRIGELCKSKNILFGVDAAQLAGKANIDMQRCYIDYLCIAPHKSFYAPTGLGVLIAEKSIDNVIISGGTGVNSIQPFQPNDFPERIESGTQNIPAILGLKAGVEFVKNKTLRKIEAHEIVLVQHLYKSLKKINAELYTIYPEQKMFAPVLSFNIKGFTSEEVGEILNKNNIAVRTGLHCAPLAHKQLKTLERGTVRVSTSLFNNYDDIDRLIFCLKRII
ncbi:MAG: aminotransferase class V-fold PLP-dependent enzyme [Clostridia bacterium]|nr:aminotransferase class V-fold PLP-dependent enzyme [Clostridia bacterium]